MSKSKDDIEIEPGSDMPEARIRPFPVEGLKEGSSKCDVSE
jgi:hypothetical protein